MPVAPPVPVPAVPPASPIPISNTRKANDLMIEICGHLVEDIVNTTLTNTTTPGATTLLQLGSTLAMYPGAQVLVANPQGGWDILTLLSVDPSTLTATATTTVSYPAGSSVLGATFPTQQPTDPLFTQTEVLSYLARAQNEFLIRVPCSYAFSTQTIDIGLEFQAVPPNTIEMERVSINGRRLYAVSQSQLSMANPSWGWNSAGLTRGVNPVSWFEDRAGYYGWGVAPVPQVNTQATVLASQRGPDVLELNSLLLVPDVMVHGVKMKALQFLWEKSGEQRSPSMARLAANRFEQIVAISNRFLEGVVNAK